MRVVLKQYRRFFRRSSLTASLASIVLAVGFAGSALAFTIMLAISSPIPRGLQSIQYATVAAETGGGARSPSPGKPTSVYLKPPGSLIPLC